MHPDKTDNNFMIPATQNYSNPYTMRTPIDPHTMRTLTARSTCLVVRSEIHKSSKFTLNRKKALNSFYTIFTNNSSPKKHLTDIFVLLELCTFLKGVCHSCILFGSWITSLDVGSHTDSLPIKIKESCMESGTHELPLISSPA